MDSQEKKAKIEIISKMTSDMPEETRIGIIKSIFENTSDDAKVDITDWCNNQMGGVAARRLGRVAVKAGDKIGDILKDSKKYTEKGARGISREFSEIFKKFTDEDGKYTGEKNAYNKDDEPN